MENECFRVFSVLETSYLASRSAPRSISDNFFSDHFQAIFALSPGPCMAALFGLQNGSKMASALSKNGLCCLPCLFSYRGLFFIVDTYNFVHQNMPVVGRNSDLWEIDPWKAHFSKGKWPHFGQNVPTSGHQWYGFPSEIHGLTSRRQSPSPRYVKTPLTSGISQKRRMYGCR